MIGIMKSEQKKGVTIVTPFLSYMDGTEEYDVWRVVLLFTRLYKQSCKL